jgi:hypothetical protein
VVNHWFGLELVDGGARLMTVLQLRQENVSKCASFRPTCCSTLRGRRADNAGAGVASERPFERLSDNRGGYLLTSRVCRSAQYKVAAKAPKAAAMSANTTMSVGIECAPFVRGA